MKEKIRVLCLAILAGCMISIGGAVFLSLENRIIGSLMFTIGLYAIVVNGLFLFTGKIGYFPIEKDKKDYFLVLVLTWLGNLIGTFIGATALLQTRISGISEVAEAICEVKFADNLLSIFILAIFCGCLMFIAVDGYKETKNLAILFLCVSVFILCGFEHCIANMFYFTLAGVWSGNTVVYLLVMTLGNSVGGMFIPFVKKLVEVQK